jgi:hypothetical protein
LKAFENELPRKIFVPKIENVGGASRILHNNGKGHPITGHEGPTRGVEV